MKDISRIVDSSPSPLILIFGPTGVGKSDFIYSLFGSACEIINADSQAVYKYLDIGTAKPQKSILETIPHHLVDIIDPREQFHVGEFVRSAVSASEDIYRRNKIPIVAGGTAFYLRNLIFGLSEAPPSNEEIRSKLKDECKERGLTALYERLMHIDPQYAKKIGGSDTMRILRALEVYEASGNPLSSFKVPEQNKRTDLFLAGLQMKREELIERIDARVDRMFEQGLVNEIKGLMKMGYSFDDPGMKSIGYKEFRAMQKGCLTLADTKELIKSNTRRFAKRQMTFFRSFKGVEWFEPHEKERFKARLEDFLNQSLEPGFNLLNLWNK
jgi:tRNA dimethylallyltransferase